MPYVEVIKGVVGIGRVLKKGEKLSVTDAEYELLKPRFIIDADIPAPKKKTAKKHVRNSK